MGRSFSQDAELPMTPEVNSRTAELCVDLKTLSLFWLLFNLILKVAVFFLF